MSQATESDERLLIEAAQNDPSRFAELYEQNFHRVYAYVARRVHDRVETQDLTAQVFHKALANLGKFKWRGAPFAAWLNRIAANSIADRAKAGDPSLKAAPIYAPRLRLDETLAARKPVLTYREPQPAEAAE